MTRGATSDDEVRQRVTQWLESAVIGLDLCPFAAGPWQAGRVHIEVSSAATFEEGVRHVLDQVVRLSSTSPETCSSTLVVFPEVWRDFNDFLDAIEDLEELLSVSGADEVIQLAHFHPRYVFAATGSDPMADYTNRSPYPIFHLLRVDEVWRALASFGDGHTIPQANIRRLTALREHVLVLWSSFMPPGDS